MFWGSFGRRLLSSRPTCGRGSLRYGAAITPAAMLALAAMFTLTMTPSPAVAASATADEGILNARGPAPSPDGSEIAFSYMGDVWRVSAEGGEAVRVTVHEAYDDNPVWSPDGARIAFTSDRKGNRDVFVTPVAGGVPEGLTCHSTWDNVQCWKRDGSSILFTSQRDTLDFELYQVSTSGGLPGRVIKDSAYNVALSPDGRWIAYTRGLTPWWRKHYRGSASRDIWIRAAVGGESYRLIGSLGDDDRPMWGADGQTLYFMSERADSVMNIWKVVLNLPPAGMRVQRPGEGDAPWSWLAQAPVQLTRHTHDGVQYARIADDGTLIVYEWNAGIWKLAVPGGRPQKVVIDAPSDLKWNDELRLDMGTASEFALSPNEKEIALVVRGEVFVCPFKDGEAGDAVRITETPAREKDITWLPDGETLLFAADRAGNYDIYAVTSAEDDETRLSKALKTRTRQLTDAPEDDFLPVVSPDGERISYMHAERRLWTMGPTGGGKRELMPHADVLHVAWSPDSRWLALSRTTMGHKEDIFIVPADGGEAVNVSVHPNDDFQPRWTDDGKRISFASRTDDGQYTLKYMWLTREDYWKTDDEREEEAEEAGSAADDDDEEAPPHVVIDFEGLHERTVTVMNMRGGYDFYAQTGDGHYYAFRSRTLGSDDLWIVDWEGNELSQVSEGGSSPERLWWDADGETCYYLSNGRIKTVSIDPGSGGITERGSVGFSALVTVDVPAERKQMFNEAWRLLLNGFYDPAFHGVDWAAIREAYEPLAMRAYTEQEFRMVIQEMIGELSASHLGIYKYDGGGASTGRLGLYHDESHRGPGIRVRKVVQDGPADRAGIVSGEYIVSIDGEDVVPGANYHCLLEDTVDREILVGVAKTAGGRDRREVRVRPVGGSMRNLVYEQWVRDNRHKVEQASDGRLGYLHIRGMGDSNLFQFEEDLFAQGEGKKGLVVDIRGNGGGSVHDQILRFLDRRNYGYTVSRTRPPSMNPLELYENPLALVIDESCYSDAEIFPMGWKALGLGPVVGTPTYGAVIGTNDLPLIDGTMFRVPGSGWFDLSGRNLENWGIEPDIRVDTIPEDGARGIDRQLEKAIEVLLGQIESR
jgi:tricorn protease